ncbi:MAG: C4-dicarboxylate ABC transporter substrate-binding protein [Rhodospirillaceae bacterium]|nr:C4-dicarboxylate ABC transporter substrate-binding protein [Rhodospirillaceae bacterium]
MADTDLSELSLGARLLAKVDAWVFKVESSFNLMSALVILGLMMLAVVQVVGRKIFNHPIEGYPDLVEFAMPVFAVLSIAYTQKLGGHIRMEFIIGRFSGRLLWFLEVLGTLIAMFTIAILCWYAYTHFLRAWNIGDSSINIDLPIWPGKILFVIAFISLQIRLWIQLAGFIRLFLYPNSKPIGVPIIETVDEQAQHEIDAGLAGEDEKVNIVGSGVSR